MRIQRVKATELELKYNHEQLSLIWEYLGPDRTHGDCYYDENRYVWFECYDVITVPRSFESTCEEVFGIICLTEDQHLPFSLHLSFLEIFNNLQGLGHGKIVMNFLEDAARSLKKKKLTLQPHKPELIKYYAKFGYKTRIINEIPIMRKNISK